MSTSNPSLNDAGYGGFLGSNDSASETENSQTMDVVDGPSTKSGAKRRGMAAGSIYIKSCPVLLFRRA